MATNDDSARLLVSIEANQRAFAKQMAAVAKQSADAAKYVEDNFKRANDNVAKGFQSGGKKVEQSLGAQRAAVSNLSFQLNDIAMGLASGTSPFTIMVQQGSQVAQVFNGTGGGLVGAVKTLGGALATMVNPVSLASFALIGLTGAAVQYITTLSSGVPDVDKYLKEHADVVRSFEDAWGIAEKGAKQYSDATRQIALQKLRDEFGSAREAIDAVGGALRDQILGISIDEFGGATKSVSDFSRALTLLEQDVPDFRQFSLEMEKIERMTGIPENIRKLARELRLSALEALPLQEHLEKVSEHLNVVRLNGEQARAAFAALTAQAVGLGADGGRAVASVAGKINTDLIPAMTAAIQKVAEFAKNYRSLQDQVNQTPLGQLSPIFSGGGQFLNPDQLQTFRASEERYRIAGESAAAQMIKGFEGFITKAKWDVNHYRVGFGSDTVTRANGVIEKVTKDTVVTLADAQRDLERRLVEFQDGIQSAIGVETWKSLNDAQQAALTSIAYNYGSLPKRIVAAIQSGGGPEVVAQAIAALGGDNGGINRGRRKEEAQAFLNGSGLSLKDAGIGGKSPADIFKGDLEQVQARIEALKAEYAAQAALNPLINDYGYAVEKAKIQQQLLNEAKKAGLEITPELRASIDELAEGYARASAATDQLRESQKAAQQAAEDMRELGRDVLGGFIRDLQAGKSASEALAGALQKVADKLLDIGLDSLFGSKGGGGGGGIFGNLLGGLFGGGGDPWAGLRTPGFASGTANTGGARGQPRGVVHGQEAVIPLPMGGKVPVQLQAPQVAQRGGSASGQPVVIKVDVSGARGNAEIKDMVFAGVSQGIDQYDRTRAPGTAVRALQQAQMRG